MTCEIALGLSSENWTFAGGLRAHYKPTHVDTQELLMRVQEGPGKINHNAKVSYKISGPVIYRSMIWSRVSARIWVWYDCKTDVDLNHRRGTDASLQSDGFIRQNVYQKPWILISCDRSIDFILRVIHWTDAAKLVAAFQDESGLVIERIIKPRFTNARDRSYDREIKR